MDEVEARTVGKQYAVLEAELQGIRLHNEELLCGLQEQEGIVVVERLWRIAENKLKCRNLQT